MSKMNWLDKPITWRTSLKFTAIGTGIALLVAAVEYIYYFDMIGKIKAKLKKNKDNDTDFEFVD